MAPRLWRRSNPPGLSGSLRTCLKGTSPISHMVRGCEHRDDVRLRIWEVPQGRVFHAACLGGDCADAQPWLVAKGPSSGQEAPKALRPIRALFQGVTVLLAGIRGQSGEGLIHHADADVQCQPAQIGVKQSVRIYSCRGGEEAGLQLVAEDLKAGL